jgi:thioredoxin reductase
MGPSGRHDVSGRAEAKETEMAETVEGLRDVLVVGGGAAGLSAALTLARARRRVTVVDAGAPRNAPAEGVHGLLGLDGISPVELLRRGRDEVTGYGGEILSGDVVSVVSSSEVFAATLSDGRVLTARRLLIATGLVDELPDIPGLRERWGRDLVHCPYCHGWEVRDRLIGVLATGPMSVHQALLFRQWTDQVRFFTHGHAVGAEDQVKLEALGVPVIDGEVSGVQLDGDRLTGVRLESGEVVEVEVLAVASRMIARIKVFEGIGILPAEHPMGSFVAADPFGRTTVPGVWAAGNSADLSAQVSAAAADGARAAMHINADLVTEDATHAVAGLTKGNS